MKPVIVLTVCRRYHELDAALTRITELAHEFAEPPDVVVVWARPEVARLWYFQKLLADGRVTKLLTRLPLPGEADGCATTSPESHNIRMGLDWVRSHYDPAATYVVVQSADVRPNPWAAYGYIDTNMQNGSGAVVFHWENGCANSGVWHTNFFAVRMDESYWPPVSAPDCQDVLEAQYGRKLDALRPPGLEKNHNYNSKRFVHAHRSESLPEWPVVPQSAPAHTLLLISGHQTWWRRWLERLRLVRPFRRPPD